MAFDQIPTTLRPLFMTVDGNNRLYFSDTTVFTTIAALDDTAAAPVDASPVDAGYAALGYSGLWTAPDGTVWAASNGTSGTATVAKRGTADPHWTLVKAGLSTAASGVLGLGFDPAGNVTALSKNNFVSSPPNTTQLYRLPAGGSTWAPLGAVFPSAQDCQAGWTLGQADGTVLVGVYSVPTSGSGIFALDAGAAGLRKLTSCTECGAHGVTLGPDGTIYGEDGPGGGTGIVIESVPDGGFALPDGGFTPFPFKGVTLANADAGILPGGPVRTCVTAAGNVYAATNRYLWIRPVGSTTWQTVPFTLPDGGTLGSFGGGSGVSAQGIACAPNGRVYLSIDFSGSGNRLFRSTP